MCPFLWAKHFCAVEIHRQSTQVCGDDVSVGVEEVKEGEGAPMMMMMMIKTVGTRKGRNRFE